MKPNLSILLAAIFSISIFSAHAEEVKIPVGAQGQSVDIKVPSKGMTQKRVKELFGEPLQIAAPVGDPPITRWDYDKFTVFFEYKHTIHAVIKPQNNNQ